MNKAGIAFCLICVMVFAHAQEKIFILAESGFVDFLQQDFHKMALSLSQKYDVKLSSKEEKGIKPVLMIQRTKPGSDYDTVLFAVRGFLFYANGKNPVSDLLSEELVQVHAGKFKKWRNTNLRPRQICYYGPEKMGPRFLEKGDAPWIRFKDAELVLQMVSFDITSLGILPLTEALIKMKGTKMLTVGGIEATPKTVMDGTYPAAVRYYLSIRKDAPGQVRKIYNNLRSNKTKQKLLNAGILPAVEGE